MIIQRSETSKSIGAALCKAQASMHAVKRDGVNPAFKRDGKPSTFASLASVIEAVRGPLTENGIAFMQAPGAMDEAGFLPVETMLLHGESGEWLSFTFPIPITKRDPQGFGSATTYGCRYALMAALGLAPVDDDGNAAAVRENGAAKPTNGTAQETAPTDREIEIASDLIGALGETPWKSISEVEDWAEAHKDQYGILPTVLQLKVSKQFEAAKLRLTPKPPAYKPIPRNGASAPLDDGRSP